MSIQSPPSTFVSAITTLTQEKEKKLTRAEKKNSEPLKVYKGYVNSNLQDIPSWLLYLIDTSKDESVQSTACKLLFSLLNAMKLDDCRINQLNNQCKTLLKAELFNLLRKGVYSKKIVNKISNCIQALAHFLLKRNEWNNFMDQLREAVVSESGSLRHVGFLLFGNQSYLMETSIVQNTEEYIKILEPGLKDSYEEVRISALHFLCNILTIGDINLDAFSHLIPLMLSTMREAFQTNDRTLIDGSVATLCDIAQLNPEWFLPHLRDFIDTFLSKLQQSKPSEILYPISFQLLLTLVENFQDEYEEKDLIIIIELIFSWVAQVKEIDINTWTNSNRNQSVDIDNNPDHTEIYEEQEEEDDEIFDEDRMDDVYKDGDTDTDPQRILSEFAYPLGLDIFFPIIMKEAKKRIQTPASWKDRYAALVTLTRLSDSLSPLFEENPVEFLNLLKLIMTVSTDENPRVRWALFNLLTQLCLDNKEAMVKYSDLFLQIITKATNDSNERVQAAGCTFLQLLLAACIEEKQIEKSVDKTYITTLLAGIEQLLKSPKLYVVENAFSALATIVAVMGENFKPYYPKFMEIALSILNTHKQSKPSRRLRRRTIKTISIMGIKVGKQMFAKDFDKLVQYVKLQGPKFDSRIDFLRSCSDAIECLGVDYAVYLPTTMKMTMDILRAEIKVDEDYEGDPLEPGLVDRKGQLLVFIGKITPYLKTIMHPYLPGMVDLAIGHLDCRFSEEVRFSAASFFVPAIQISKAKYGRDSQETKALFIKLLHSLLESLKSNETTPDLLFEKASTTMEIIEVMGNYCMTFEDIVEAIAMCNAVKDKLFQILQNIQDEETDEEGVDPKEAVGDAIGTIYEIIGEIVKKNKERSVNAVVDLFPDALRLLKKRKEETIKSSILCLFAYYIEFGGESTIASYPQLIPTFFDGIDPRRQSYTKQNASFGLGVAAQAGKDKFGSYALNALQLFKTLLSSPKAFNEENRASSENAISAIGKFIRYVPQLSPYVSQIIPTWLSQLPIIDDDVESAITMENLYAILHLYTEECIGKDGCNVTQLFKIVGFYKNKLKELRNQKEEESRDAMLIDDDDDDDKVEMKEETLDNILEVVKANWDVGKNFVLDPYFAR